VLHLALTNLVAILKKLSIVVTTTRIPHGKPHRSAKSGSDWTQNDLLAYNIKLSSQSPLSFYGNPLPPVGSLNNLDPNLVSGTLSTQGLKDDTYRLLQYLHLASTANAGQESAIHDFARDILRVLGYEIYEMRGLLLRSRYAIPLYSTSVVKIDQRKQPLPSFMARQPSF
jgi:hypothetical protein